LPAPLQWIAVAGLRQTGRDAQAHRALSGGGRLLPRWAMPSAL